MGFAAFAQGAAGGLMQGWEDNREAAKAKAKEAFALSLEQSKQDAQRDQTTREIAARSDQQIMGDEAQMEQQLAKDAAHMARQREANASAERVASIRAGAVKPGDHKSKYPVYWKHYDDIADASSALNTWYSDQVSLDGEPSKAVVDQYTNQRKRLMERRVELEEAFRGENPSNVWNWEKYDAGEAAGVPTDAPADVDTTKDDKKALWQQSPAGRTAAKLEEGKVAAQVEESNKATDDFLNKMASGKDTWAARQRGGPTAFGRTERGGGERRFKNTQLMRLQSIAVNPESSPEQRQRAFELYQQISGVTLDDNP